MPSTTSRFSSLSKEEKLSLVLSLQEKRRELKTAAQRRSKKRSSAPRKKKKEKFLFKDPGCQALWNMAMDAYKKKLEEEEKKEKEKC